MPVLFSQSRVAVEVREVASLSTAELDELYQISSKMAAEERDHWVQHVSSQPVLHLFRHQGQQEISGFQCWGPLRFGRGGSDVAVVTGGKLRLAPSLRGLGVPQLSGMLHLSRSMEEQPSVRRWLRLSLASVLGYNSIRSGLHSVFYLNRHSDDARASALLSDTCRDICRLSGYSFDPHTSLVRVNISPALTSLPPNFASRPAVREYEAMNPHWRVNGSYVAFAWDFDELNLQTMLSCLDLKLNASVF
ncbi:MAG: hypothetical protein Q8P67_07175 [archaeon]|nr:hypothetical protein [archaeon]